MTLQGHSCLQLLNLLHKQMLKKLFYMRTPKVKRFNSVVDMIDSHIRS